MKMKIALSFSLTIFTAFSSRAAEPGPFAAPEPDPPRPERVISKLPQSVTCQKGDGGVYAYGISKIYNAPDGKNGEDSLSSIYEALVPACISFKLSLEDRSCTFSTSRELTLSELAYALDDMAELGGDLPYWAELEARDIPRSELAGKRIYSTLPVTTNTPSGLAWFWLLDDQPFRIPLGSSVPESGSLLIVPSTAQCMCHPRYVLRILDEKGLLVWSDERNLFAGVKIALTDLDNDSVHEIWIERDDHGEKARFQIKKAPGNPTESEDSLK